VNRVLFNEPTVEYRLPRPPAVAFRPGAFVICPVFPAAAEQLQCQMALYRLAYERAQAGLQSSLLERDLLGFWN
jgi:hypothetical protein